MNNKHYFRKEEEEVERSFGNLCRHSNRNPSDDDVGEM